MANLPQPRNGETATERQQRREALLTYGHLFADIHRRLAGQDTNGGLSAGQPAQSPTPKQTEKDA
jgi:hypothetical protein